ncbi:hypothetical protein [Phormidesmis sp. 146-33]
MTNLTRYNQDAGDRQTAAHDESLFGHYVQEQGWTVKETLENLAPIANQTLAQTVFVASTSKWLAVAGAVIGLFGGASVGFIGTLPLGAAALAFMAYREANQCISRRKIELKALKNCPNLLELMYGCSLRGADTVNLIAAWDIFLDNYKESGAADARLMAQEYLRILDQLSFVVDEDGEVIQQKPKEFAASPQVGEQTRLGAVEVPVSPAASSPAQIQPTENELFNPAIDLGQNPQSALIAGIPGSGKGMVVSNALRVLKQKHPALKVFVIDPKFDPNERGYWDSVADIYRGKAFEDLDDADEGATWILRCLREFQKLPAPKLLIFDESLNVSNVLGLADKEMKAPQKVKLMLSSAITGGDSRGIWAWVLGQSVQVQDLPFNGGVRGNLRVLAIVSEKNLTAIEPLLSTKLIPPPSGGMAELRRLIKASPCNRAFFDGKSSQWLSMPRLENHSGFDRDNRTIEAPSTVRNDAPKSQEKSAEAPKQDKPKISTTPQDLNRMFNLPAADHEVEEVEAERQDTTAIDLKNAFPGWNEKMIGVAVKVIFHLRSKGNLKAHEIKSGTSELRAADRTKTDKLLTELVAKSFVQMTDGNYSIAPSAESDDELNW